MYEINNETCALIAQNASTTEVIEEKRTFIINAPLSQILKESCEYYGSTLEGRIKGSKKQLGMCYKLPITIEGSNDIIFFPTTSYENENCCWLSLKHIKEYKEYDNNTLVTFLNNEKRVFQLSLPSLENQLFRATKLLLISRRRRNSEI